MIPLGILASSAGGAAGAYELISSTVLGSDTASVTFSSIDQTYKHLQIRYTARSTVASAADDTVLRFNGVSTSTYFSHYLYGNGSTVSSGNILSQNVMYLDQSPGATNTTDAFGAGIVDILDYTSTLKNKTVRTLTGYHGAGSKSVWMGSGSIALTAAITSITLLTANSANHKAGSRFSLYGIKGA